MRPCRATRWPTLRLEQIERAGLFASALSADEPTLRLHDLFREALETRFAREQPLRFQAVLERAAATEPDPARRVAWLQRAGAWDEAEEALFAAAEDLDAAGAATQVRALLDRFPADRRQRSARLQMLLARNLWDWDASVEALQRAADAFQAQGAQQDRLSALSYRCLALSGANRHAQVRAAAADLLRDPALAGDALARTLVALGWVELPRGDQRALAPLWERLIDTLRRSGSLARWTECAPRGPLVGLPGMRAPLQRFVDEAQRLCPEQATPLRGMCHLLQGWLQLWVGDVAAAEASAEAAAADARWLAAPASLDAPSRSLRAVLLAVRGRRDAALETLASIVAQIRASTVPLRVEVYLGLYEWLAMRCAALLDDPASVRAWAAPLAARGAGDRSWLSERQLASAAAHLAAADGDLDAACRRWREMLEDGSRGDLYGQLVETRLRLADGLLRSGAGAPQAADVLGPLFDDLDASGEWGAVLMAGPKLLQRLAGADWRGALPADRCARLAAWSAHATALTRCEIQPPATAAAMPRPDAAAPSAAAGARVAPAVPLSPRELEVLSMLAAGDSNKLIARALDLSPHTVKRHVANILDKLALASRGQAAAWFHGHP